MPTYAELRQALNLGKRRLRMLLTLQQLPEVEDQEFVGSVTFFVGANHVRYLVQQGKTEAPDCDAA